MLNINQIANLPLVSRNPLNFVVLLPGVNTARGNRDSTVNGLPQSAIDITLDGINIQDNFNKTTDGIVNAHSVTAPTRRNPLMRDLSNTMTWTRGAHSLSFGGKFTWVTLTYNAQTLVPSIVFSTHSSDPANAIFVTANCPGAASADLTRAANIYAVLTGRVTAINANARLIEETGQYKYLGNAFERSRQNELGVFAQDSWRVRPGLTLNYGLRWEVQGPFHPLNSSYTTASIEDIWGVSGPGNLFKPGVMPGRVTQFIQFKKGVGGYNTDYKNFAPSFGFAWSPNPTGGLPKKILGGRGITVIRGAYSIAYSRRGFGDFRGTFSSNPGVIITTNRDMTVGNLVGGTLGSLPLLFREKDRLGPPAFDTEPKYPLTGAVTASAVLHIPTHDAQRSAIPLLSRGQKNTILFSPNNGF